jgi:hypothetical protein
MRLAVLALSAVMAVGTPLVDGARAVPESLPDCDLHWEQVCPVEPAPGAGATPGGPYTTDLTATEEQWRPLIAKYFCHGYAVEEAMRVSACESNGIADVVNPLSGTTGLFQHQPEYWAERSAQAGWPGASIYDPEANVAVAAWLWKSAGGWSHFHCRPIP